ncbi:hypothetical protein BV22DRAFT_309259 [Leucogyrophana mollusca]|uniref:Uncharacterized protein n=1 Tax=Leucogyrophana mollusca TaxID=85980 RepID=A0ACB8BNE8_9AGAM|nr:hypothetical protein BV22DRAFT_309259 [Leucogyrophana mollusca]
MPKRQPSVTTRRSESGIPVQLALRVWNAVRDIIYGGIGTATGPSQAYATSNNGAREAMPPDMPRQRRASTGGISLADSSFYAISDISSNSEPPSPMHDSQDAAPSARGGSTIIKHYVKKNYRINVFVNSQVAPRSTGATVNNDGHDNSGFNGTWTQAPRVGPSVSLSRFRRRSRGGERL